MGFVELELVAFPPPRSTVTDGSTAFLALGFALAFGVPAGCAGRMVAHDDGSGLFLSLGSGSEIESGVSPLATNNILRNLSAALQPACLPACSLGINFCFSNKSQR